MQDYNYTIHNMFNISHNWLISILLFFLLVLTWWLDNKIAKEDVITDGTQIPDVFINEFSATKFDSNGLVKYKLSGNEFSFFENQKESFLKMPVLKQIENNNTTSKFQSNLAIIDNYENIITLKKNVSLKKTSEFKKDDLGIFTEKLKIFTDKELVTSKEAVIIHKENTKLTSIGFEYDNKQKKITLKRNVKAYYGNPRAE